jgi:tetratricopeptide (TPR) repeat protein
MGYYIDDVDIVDYQFYCLDRQIIEPYYGNALKLRGPKPTNIKKNNYFVCIGAAQTFGRFCEKPYPNLLQEKLNIEALNLGYAGAGPSFFLKCFETNPKLIEYINNANFVIIQVMSARSQENSLIGDCRGFFLTRKNDGVIVKCEDIYKHLLEEKDEINLKKIIKETRQNWIDSYERLLTQIKVPKILFWFSERSPEYEEKYNRGQVHALFGKFPQLVNSDMIAQIKNYSDEYVECISNRGMPQTLINRFTGNQLILNQEWNNKKVTHNHYYPSPAMHIDAVNNLEDICRKILKNNLFTNMVNTLDEASFAYRSLTQKDLNSPNIHKYYLELGDALDKKGELSQAVECYLQAIQIKPGFWQPHRRLRKKLNIIVKETEITSTIIDTYQKIITTKIKDESANRDLTLTYISLGDILTKQGKIKEAIQAYQTGCYVKNLKLKPKFVNNYWDYNQSEKKPKFIIFGAPRCGSTSLYNYLTNHPKIIPALEKEIKFFNDNFTAGIDWYKSHFPPLPQGKGFLTGEASIDYIAYPKVPKEIFNLFPDIKLIAVLRNPVDKAISQFHHWTKLGLEQKYFKEIIASEIDLIQEIVQSNSTKVKKEANQQTYLLGSVYIYFLKNWLDLFPKEQFLIIRSEDLFSKPVETMNQIYKFLEVPKFELANYKVYNSRSYSPSDEDTYKKLTEFFRPYNEQLEDYLGRKLDWNNA